MNHNSGNMNQIKNNTYKKSDKKSDKKSNNNFIDDQLPFVSICTPTFNRRPFYPMIIKCFEHQTYPREKMEWIIIDDGSDKIEDLIKNIPQVKYFRYEEKMTLGKKRNLMHEKAKGDILVYMDDDDYYPPERVQHAVETLQKNPDAMIVGSSEMFIYFKHIHKMYKFGPYGPRHATAATFAFRREYLKLSRYDDDAAVSEEKAFLKNYETNLVQLDSKKTILVFSHIHNSFDKKKLLEQPPSSYMTQMNNVTLDDFNMGQYMKDFFMIDIDKLLNDYELGNPKYKPDVLQQMDELTKKREMVMAERNNVNELQTKIAQYEAKIAQQHALIQRLIKENLLLKDKLDK